MKSNVESSLAAVRELAAQIFAETDCAECPVPAVKWGATTRRRPALSGYRWSERVKRKKVKGPKPVAKTGEVRLVDFRRAEAQRCGVSACVIYERIMAGKYPGLKLRRTHARCIFVKMPAVMPGMDNAAQPGEVSMKDFVRSEAERRGVGENAIYNNIWRGRYPNLEYRRVNKRVVFVKTKAK